LHVLIVACGSSLSIITVGLHKFMEAHWFFHNYQAPPAAYLFDRQGRFVPQARTQRELLRIGFAPGHKVASGTPFGFKLLGQDSFCSVPRLMMW
jgi:hypothetical protein